MSLRSRCSHTPPRIPLPLIRVRVRDRVGVRVGPRVRVRDRVGVRVGVRARVRVRFRGWITSYDFTLHFL